MSVLSKTAGIAGCILTGLPFGLKGTALHSFQITETECSSSCTSLGLSISTSNHSSQIHQLSARIGKSSQNEEILFWGCQSVSIMGLHPQLLMRRKKRCCFLLIGFWLLCAMVFYRQIYGASWIIRIFSFCSGGNHILVENSFFNGGL